MLSGLVPKEDSHIHFQADRRGISFLQIHQHLDNTYILTFIRGAAEDGLVAHDGFYKNDRSIAPRPALSAWANLRPLPHPQ